MNILLWILQVILGLHTAMGAVWKFSHNAELTMPSLAAIPDGVWMTMAAMELVCSVALLLPIFRRPLMKWVPGAAIIIAVEMLAFCGLHLASGDTNYAPMGYWIVVAIICAFVAYGRCSKKRN